jgi:ABC-type sugar transport system permease subunit
MTGEPVPRTAVALRDPALWMAVPATLFVVAVFVYPFLSGLVLSFTPEGKDALANYLEFWNKPSLWNTIGTTMKLALPATLLNVGWRSRWPTGCATAARSRRSPPPWSRCR